MDGNTTRFRSFAERYLLTRSHLFKQGRELEDAHACVLEARTVYKIIGGVQDPDTWPDGTPKQGSKK
jgi:hypothetical protein